MSATAAVNPAVGLDNSRPGSLLFEVIGASEASLVRLPNDPPYSQLRHDRQVLLRLQWILDAVCVSHPAPTLFPTAPPIDGPTILRIILFILKICTSNKTVGGSSLDYTIFRFVALDALVAATRVLLLSKYNVSLEEEDLVMTQIQALVNAWDQKRSLSLTEKAFLEDMLPGSIVLQYENGVQSTRLSPEEDAERQFATVLTKGCATPDTFWTLRDTLMNLIIAPPMDHRVDGAGRYDPSPILRIIATASEQSRSGNVSVLSTAIVQYLAERISFTINRTQQSLSGDHLLLDKQLAMRMGRVLRLEIDEFRRSFHTLKKDDSVLQWVEDRTSTLSPLSVKSEEQYSSRDISSCSSPTDIRASLASISNHMNATLHVEPLRLKSSADIRDSDSLQSPKWNLPCNPAASKAESPPETDAGIHLDLTEADQHLPMELQNRSDSAATEIAQPAIKMIQDATAALARDVPPRKPVPAPSRPAVAQPHAQAWVSRTTSPSTLPQALRPGLPLESFRVAFDALHSGPPSNPPSVPLPPIPSPKSSEVAHKRPSGGFMGPPAHIQQQPPSFAAERKSIRDVGQHLPVSTFNPTSKQQQTTKRISYENYPEVVEPPPEPPQFLHNHGNPERIASGLEFVDKSTIVLPKRIDQNVELLPWAPQDYEKASGLAHTLQPPPFPQDRRRESITTATDSHSVSNLSSSASIASRKKSRFFGRLMGSGKSALDPLPPSLDFCFSSCGRHLALWCKKDPISFVHIDAPFHTGRCHELVVPNNVRLPDGKQRSRSIRHLAASGAVVVAVVHIEDSRWIYCLKEDKLQPALVIDEGTPVVLALALSPDGANIALGCGKYTLVYRKLNEELRGPWKLSPSADIGSHAVRVHKVNFSVDSKRLISSMQVEKNSHKHAVHVSIWTCFGSDIKLESQLDPVNLTVGYADDTGISSISLVGHSDSKLIQQVFLTAVLSKSYPSILFVAPGSKNKHLDVPDTRVDNSAQSLAATSSHLFCIRSGRNKIFRVDVRNGATELVANFSTERKNLHLRYDHIALGMYSSDTIHCMWRTADENIVLKTSVLANGKWTTTSAELGPIYRQLAGIS
ncbi:uncharacterized protein BDR25DRAFT_346915 [Lindgomyces ingoldianus]|uniref:Uncharacterized protein n=1 Tax=Lindgomyces ingoldianus TaxID=673940 RepID=A0ACB6QAQ8_9PLEO|nr:uncharacterized protein BDR25DRAFT_346915 [Lindgomyces ingoldianus]KAF2463997.1 hypothetical protein BDR25DRAFT_346915 [Lindgomyces ingoldianus]